MEEEEQHQYNAASHLMSKIKGELATTELNFLIKICGNIDWLRTNFEGVLLVMRAGDKFSDEEIDALIAKSKNPLIKGFLQL